jgi:hypothetical protein
MDGRSDLSRMKRDDTKARQGKELLFVNRFARPDSDAAARRHRDAKKQKNFIYSAAGALATDSPNGTVQRRKSFLVLFFKKEPLSFFY